MKYDPVLKNYFKHVQNLSLPMSGMINLCCSQETFAFCKNDLPRVRIIDYLSRITSMVVKAKPQEELKGKGRRNLRKCEDWFNCNN